MTPDFTTQEIFENIYKTNFWRKEKNISNEYYSGYGSRDQNIVEPYINSVKNVLKEINENLTAIDLGCGDFNVGSKLYPFFTKYIACDIVPDLIKFNRKKFISPNLEFQHIDISEDSLPHGDIVFIRQVLQHLSNTQIFNILNKIKNLYKHIVITEHLPTKNNFTSNKEIEKVGSWRYINDSGVIITDPPFNFKAVFQSEICNVSPKQGGRIVTTYYKAF